MVVAAALGKLTAGVAPRDWLKVFKWLGRAMRVVLWEVFLVLSGLARSAWLADWPTVWLACQGSRRVGLGGAVSLHRVHQRARCHVVSPSAQ